VDDAFRLLAATPVLASLDIRRSTAFARDALGFAVVHEAQGAYGIVERDGVELHFWACTDRAIAEATGCRIRVRGIDALHARCAALGIVHPNAPLGPRPWGGTEFAILDPDGNLITFHERTP
jgi:catechol 2,3-dioxygenase-like lactoylglutathione lyase family enzyme